MREIRRWGASGEELGRWSRGKGWGEEEKVGKVEEGSQRFAGKIAVVLSMHPTFIEPLVMQGYSKQNVLTQDSII